MISSFGDELIMGMTFIGGCLLFIGAINAGISLYNHREKGFNITRLKFVFYNWALLIIGLVVFILGLVMGR